MKIAVVGPIGQDSFADNLINTFGRMGHEVKALGATRPPLPIRRVNSLVSLLSDGLRSIDGYRQRSMAETVTEFRPDLLLTIDRRLHPVVIDAAHSVGAKVALWFPDATSTMGNHDMFLAGYDRIYLKNPDLVRDLAGIQGLPVKHLPEAANSSWHRSELPYGTVSEVVMAGNAHPTRAVLIDRLIGDGIPVRLYGAPTPGWVDFPRVHSAHTGRYLAGQEKADVFRSARAVLNNLHPAEAAGMNCRLFEAAAAGAAVVVEHRPGLDDLFDVDREVFGFSSYEELITTLRTLLDSPEAGRPVADAAAARAHRDHTYELRIDSILADLF